MMTICCNQVLHKATAAYSDRLYYGGPTPYMEEKVSQPYKHHIKSVVSGLGRKCLEMEM